MVTKSKLKMALVAEKGIDFKKEKQKKLAKKARREKMRGCDTLADEWEDMDEEDEGNEEEVAEDEDGGVALDEDGEEGENDATAKIDFAGVDESDSDSSSGFDGASGLQDVEDEDGEGGEDIPISDLEDLGEEEREDIIPHQRLTINNTAALTTSLRRIGLPINQWTFSEHQSIVTTEPVSIPDVSDDLNRELAFYAQSLSAVKEARKLLTAEGAPFSRPKDYFAEMVKADEHMAKIKAKLIEEAASKKAAAEARKQRDLKKFGKQVQVAKLQERDKERKQTLEKIKMLKRKRQGGNASTGANESDLFDVALEEFTFKPDSSRRDRRDRGQPNKRQKKDAKFGFGGKKRFAKSGDAISSGDLTGFSAKKMKMKTERPSSVKIRPGKARRAGARR